jgi:hypothetical protein
MKGTLAYLRQDPGSAAAVPASLSPLEVVVPYTTPALAAEALSTAVELARGFDAVVTLIAVHVLPYPAPLECQEGIRQKMEAQLAAIARTTSATVRVKLVFARNRTDAYLGILPRRSLIVVGGRKRWWRTKEELFARKLAAAGHSVALVKVK